MFIPAGFLEGWPSHGFCDRPQMVLSQQTEDRLTRLQPESTYCTNLEGCLPIRRLSYDWFRPPPSRLGAPSTFKNDGERAFVSFSTSPSSLFFQWPRTLSLRPSLAPLPNKIMSTIKTTTYSCFIPLVRDSSRQEIAFSPRYVSLQGTLGATPILLLVSHGFLQPSGV